MHEVLLRPNRLKQVLLADPTFVEHSNHSNGAIAAWSMSGIHIFKGPEFQHVETPFPCTLVPSNSDPININKKGFGPRALAEYVRAVTTSGNGELHLPLRPFFYNEPNNSTTYLYMEDLVIPWENKTMQPSYSSIQVSATQDLYEWTPPKSVLKESKEYHLPASPCVFREKSGTLKLNFAHGEFMPGNSTLNEPSTVSVANSVDGTPMSDFKPEGPISVIGQEGEKIEHVGSVRVRSIQETGDEIITCNPFYSNTNGNGTFVSSLCRAKRIGNDSYQVIESLSATNRRAENAYVGDIMHQGGKASFIYNVRERIHPLLDNGLSGNGLMGIIVLLVKNILTGNELIYKTPLEI